MTEELVTFETAKLAKAKGFDELCKHSWEWYEHEGKKIGPLAHRYTYIDIREFGPETYKMFRGKPDLYEKVCGPHRNSDLPPYLYARPTHDLLEKWLREKNDIHIFAKLGGLFEGKPFWKAGNYVRYSLFQEKDEIPEMYETHTQAREAAIYHALTLIP